MHAGLRKRFQSHVRFLLTLRLHVLIMAALRAVRISRFWTSLAALKDVSPASQSAKMLVYQGWDGISVSLHSLELTNLGENTSLKAARLASQTAFARVVCAFDSNSATSVAQAASKVLLGCAATTYCRSTVLVSTARLPVRPQLCGVSKAGTNRWCSVQLGRLWCR